MTVLRLGLIIRQTDRQAGRQTDRQRQSEDKPTDKLGAVQLGERRRREGGWGEGV